MGHKEYYLYGLLKWASPTGPQLETQPEPIRVLAQSSPIKVICTYLQFIKNKKRKN